jgi:uncharacterized damage-inducible protein DinB
MNISDIQTLYAYNRWANQRMFSVLETLSKDQLSTEMTSSFPSIQESVLHILAAEWIWLKRWTGRSPRASVTNAGTSFMMLSALSDGGVATETLSSLAGLRSFSGSLEQERGEFLRGLTDERLLAPLTFSDMSGVEHSAPLVHLMQHLVNHGTYHRGQVTTLLRQAGAETIALDMLYFFREREEQTR